MSRDFQLMTSKVCEMAILSMGEYNLLFQGYLWLGRFPEEVAGIMKILNGLPEKQNGLSGSCSCMLWTASLPFQRHRL